jgi:GT2 family glycosyltransferase
MTAKLRALPWLILLLPLDVIVALSLLIVSAAGLFQGKRDERQSANAGVTTRSATIIVVNWDGKHLLAESLPALIEAVRIEGGTHDVLVVDNGSTDGSVDFIRRQFPGVRVLALDRNYGFSGGNNRGVAQAGTDLVVFLNNDMIVDRGFLKPLLEGFADPSVFAVTSQIFFADPSRRREETGKTRGRFTRGLFELWHDAITSSDESTARIPVFWAGGGSCALDRHKYMAIGGLDPLYHPFYVEDADLSYQAWKRGWSSLLAPASHVLHKHRGTTQPKFGRDFVENTIRKNHFLLVWKNVTDAGMLFEHVLNLPWIHGRAILEHGGAFELKAYARAFRQLPEAMLKRLSNAPHYVINDRDVLARSQKA